jgi:PAS domain-containing protein
VIWVAIATGLGFLLLNVPRTFQFPMFFLMLAICAATVFYTVKGGIVATVSAVLLLWCFVIPPAGFGSMAPGAAAWLGSFAVVGLLIVCVIHSIARNLFFMQRMLDSVQDAVIMLNQNGKIVYMNRTAEELTSVRLAQAQGQSPDSTFGPDYLKTFEGLLYVFSERSGLQEPR